MRGRNADAFFRVDSDWLAHLNLSRPPCPAPRRCQRLGYSHIPISFLVARDTHTQCSDLQVYKTLGPHHHVFPVPAPHAQFPVGHASQEHAELASAAKQPRQWQWPFASSLYAAQHTLVAAGIEPTVLPVFACQRRSLISPSPQHGEPEPEPCRPRCRPQLASAAHDQLSDHEEREPERRR